MSGVSREFKIGVIVVISIVVLVMGVNYLKGVNLFEESTSYYAVYDNVDGLATANPVIYNGFKIGIVRKIDFAPVGNGNFVVEMNITEDRLKITEGTRAKIISSDLFGSKAIQLELSDSTTFVQPGDTLMSDIEMGLAEAVRKELMPLKNKTDQLIDGVDDILVNLKAVFDDDATKGLPQAFESLERTMKNLEQTSLRLDNTIEENQSTLRSIFSNVESITKNLENNNEALTNVMQNFSTLSDSLVKIDFASTMSKADQALADFAEISEKINNGEGSISLLLNNDSLHNSLVDSNKELQFLLNDLYMNPWRYVHVSIFGKKPKEKYSKKELEQLRELINEEIKE